MGDGMVALRDCKHGIEWGTCEDCNGSNGGSASYYELPPDCKTLQDIIVRRNMGFTQGNIFKAAYRWDHKPSLSYNLEKIKWFATDALERIYAEWKRDARK
jgi:hypothetical protein